MNRGSYWFCKATRKVRMISIFNVGLPNTNLEAALFNTPPPPLCNMNDAIDVIDVASTGD